MDRRQKSLFNLAVSLSDNKAVDLPATTDTLGTGHKLDTQVLDQIFGPDDATLMRDAYSVIISKDEDGPGLDDRLVAIDNFHMLIELIDNANNIESMNMWTGLLSIVRDKNEDEAIVRGTCSVLATVVQNNPKSQASLLKYGGIEDMLELCGRADTRGTIKPKAVAVLTSGLRHNETGLKRFQELSGWQVLADFVKYSDAAKDESVLKRLTFFVGTLLLEDGEAVESIAEQVLMSGLLDSILDRLSPISQISEDMCEKLLNTIAGIAEKMPNLSVNLKNRLPMILPTLKTIYGDTIESDVWDRIDSL